MEILKNKKKIIRRKSPLPGMTKEARPIWTAIFKEYPPRYFSPGVYDLIRVQCEQISTYNRILRQLSEMGPILKNEITGELQKNPLLGYPNEIKESILEYHDLLDLKPELLDRFCKPIFEIVRENKILQK